MKIHAITTIWCLAALVTISRTNLIFAQAKEAVKPNIIVIMADDLDSRQLSCYGGKNIHTKNIDALATEGLKFNQMIASEAMCIPTRASLFTGLYPARHGAYQNHKPVYNNLRSVAHYLGNLGYKVGLSGKDHVTEPKSVFPFQIVPGFEPNCVANTDNYFLDSVKTFISANDKPYCLFIMSINPHAPWTVGDPSEFNADRLTLPPHWVDTRQTRNAFCKYLAEVRRLDNQVGDITRLLKETGQDENTIVIFLGEQGPQFPGGKWTLWDNGAKSSMIVKWPGKVKPKTETDAILQYEDITPTLVDIAGGSVIEGLDGRSALNVITGKRSRHRDQAFLIHNNIPEGPAYPMRAVRDDKFKLILNLNAEKPYYIKYMMDTSVRTLPYTTWINKSRTDRMAGLLTTRISNRPAIEFYDIKADPFELHNLAAKPEYKDEVKRYQAMLEAWMAEQKDTGAAMDIPIERK